MRECVCASAVPSNNRAYSFVCQGLQVIFFFYFILFYSMFALHKCFAHSLHTQKPNQPNTSLNIQLKFIPHMILTLCSLAPYEPIGSFSRFCIEFFFSFIFKLKKHEITRNLHIDFQNHLHSFRASKGVNWNRIFHRYFVHDFFSIGIGYSSEFKITLFFFTFIFVDNFSNNLYQINGNTVSFQTRLNQIAEIKCERISFNCWQQRSTWKCQLKRLLKIIYEFTVWITNKLV